MFPKGDKGDPGNAATIAPGTVTMLSPGSPATVTNSGTSSAAIFNFGIPAATPGDDGRDAWTTLTASFVMPNNNGFSSVAVTVANNAFISLTEILVVGGNYMQVTGKSGTTNLVLYNLQNAAVTGSYPGNAAPGTVIGIGTLVSAGGWQGPRGIAGQNGLSALALTGTGVPTSNPDQAAAMYYDGATNGHVWTWAAGGPWVDSGFVWRQPGIQGDPGHTPALFMQPGVPSGGVNGDWSIRQNNAGLLTFWANNNNVWTQGASLLANRLIGWSATNPNSLSLVANAGDQYITLVGTVVTFWGYTGATWVSIFYFDTAGGGGGGVGTFQQVANASSQFTGLLTWKLQRGIFFEPNTVSHSTPGATVVFLLDRPKTILTASAHVRLGYDSLTNGDPACPYVFEIYNPTAAEIDLKYTAGWTKEPDVNHPTNLLPGRRISLVCRVHDGKLNVVAVQTGSATIPVT